LGRSAELSFVELSDNGSFGPVTFGQPIIAVHPVAFEPVTFSITFNSVTVQRSISAAALFVHGTDAFGRWPGRFCGQ
jgi:hypothetical protein